MKAALRTSALAFLLLFGTARCLGQVYSVYIHAGGLSVRDWWVIGSQPYQFGLEEMLYYTDARGYTVIGTPNAGDTAHYDTRVLLGPFSFSIALRPPVVAMIGGGGLLVTVFLVAIIGLMRSRPHIARFVPVAAITSNG